MMKKSEKLALVSVGVGIGAGCLWAYRLHGIGIAGIVFSATIAGGLYSALLRTAADESVVDSKAINKKEKE
jgi:hypothetical protein